MLNNIIGGTGLNGRPCTKMKGFIRRKSTAPRQMSGSANKGETPTAPPNAGRLS